MVFQRETTAAFKAGLRLAAVPARSMWSPEVTL
jgi:hypothetical protein